MKKLLLLLILFFNICILHAQVNEKRLSISYSNESKLDVLKKIESITDYKFYFISSWLDETKISGKYQNKSISEILKEVFKNTVINFYISNDNRIILTKNNLIYSSLPKDFLKTSKEKTNKKVTETPIFYVQEITPKNKKVETLIVGKKTKNTQKNKFKLSGFIKNTVTKKPISDAVISVIGKKQNSISNSKGFYEINLSPGENLLEISSLGYKKLKKRVVIYNDETLNFAIKEETEVLEEVVIDAEKGKNTKTSITGVTKIKVEGIKNIPLVLGERDILKVALTLPGIKNAGEGAAGYNVRGGKEDQNLILLDEVVLYNPSHFFGIFSALNPFTTGDATIYTGSIPAEYGGRLSSVFDIRTKSGNTEKLTGEASIGPVTSNLALEIPIVKNKSSLIVGGRATYSDWILKSLKNKSLSKSEASFYDFVMKYNHKINQNNNVEATAHYSKDKFSITSDSLYSYSNRLISLKWNHTFNEKNKGKLILANSEYKFNINYDGEPTRNFDLGYKINDSQLKLKMTYKHNNKHKLDYGVSSRLYVVNPGSIDPKGNQSLIDPFSVSSEKALESAAFISDQFTVNDKLEINAGLRYSLFSALGSSSQRRYIKGLPKNEGTVLDTLNFGKNQVIKNYSGPEARISARYFLTPDLSLKTSFNSTYQYIHTLSNNTTVSPTDTWKLSDYNIEPQRASQVSLGIFKNFDDDKYELSLEGYYKKSKNILDYKVGANLLLNEHIETEVIQGEGKAYGVELLLKNPNGKLNGWLSYSYSRSFVRLDSEFNEETVNSGNYFPSNFDKPHDISIVTNYKLTKRYSLSANFAYQTGRPITYPVGNYTFNGVEYVNYSNRNEFRIPDYYRLDIGVNIEGNHKIKKFAHSFWNISIYNVLGRNNPYSVFFVSEKGEIKAYKSSIFSVPIPTITFNFKF